jgi:hypothetical protein
VTLEGTLRLTRLSSLTLVLSAVTPGTLSAQSLAQLLPRLLSESVTMPSTAPGVTGNPHEAHFLPDAAQLTAPYALNVAVVSQLSTFPIGTSSGGFTYTTDERTGVPRRSSNNFGPAFAERASTMGKGRFNAGVNFQRVEYDRFEGTDLDGGQIPFYLRHNECCPGQGIDGTPRVSPPVPTQDANPAFEGDLVEARLSLKATTETAAFFASVGLTNRLDVGIAVPIVRVELDATMQSTLERLSTAANPAIHSFAAAGSGANPDRRFASERADASGLGDIVLRTKLNVLSRPGGGLALGADVRLPTGDENELLGTGATQVRPYLIYSEDFGRVSPHLNLGYTLSSGSLSADAARFALGDEVPTPISTAPGAYDTVFAGSTPATVATSLEVPDEVNYTVGLVVSAHPRFSLSFDAIGRTLLDVNRFGTVTKSFDYRLANAGPLLSTTRDAFDITNAKGNLNLLLGVAGLKWNLFGTLLLNAHVIFPLSDDGLRPGITPVVGIDYAF